VSAVLFFLDQYYLFSNYSALAVKYKGIVYPTSEHAYQAAKFTKRKISNMIRDAQSPSEAKKISDLHKDDLRTDWFSIKVQTMSEILHEKAKQHEELQKKLTETGNAQIIENSDDDFWGRGKDNNGQNLLGKIWMQIRKELTNSRLTE
jgi:ribA/ribD-fused uncharacterized protein